MTTTATAEPKPYHPKPYHHGDLRRALLEAAILIVERDGAHALTLRAVAREAGVSAAAPYHHFKDKSDLLYDVAKEGFRRMRTTTMEADMSTDPHARGVAYVQFAHTHPALYRVMYDCARNMERLPLGDETDDNSVKVMRNALMDAGAGETNETDLGMRAIAAWCIAHGVAEISAFNQFQALKDAMGGEEAFLRAIFERLAHLTSKPSDTPCD